MDILNELNIIEPNLDKDGNKIVGGIPPQPENLAKRRKPKFSDLITDAQVRSLVTTALQLAGSGDTTMLKFALEQHFGKAPQSMDITSDGEPIPLLNALHNNNGGQETVKAE